MVNAGRVACIFTPYALSIASLVCLILVFLGSTQPTHPLNSIYFIEADLSKIKVNPTGLASDILPFGKALQQAEASGKLYKRYTVGLWNHCYEEKNGEFKCTPKKAKYWFDPIESWNLPKEANSFIPKALSKGLDTYRKVAQWLFVVYAIALAASVVQIVVGISAIFSRWGSFVTTIVASVSTVFTLLASATATALYGILTGAIDSGLKPFNIKADLGSRMFGITWLASLFALGGGIFWLMSVCCCSGRSPYGHREGKGRRGLEAEKAPYTYERVTTPYGGNHGGQPAMPLNPINAPHGAAYEPYRHQ